MNILRSYTIVPVQAVTCQMFKHLPKIQVETRRSKYYNNRHRHQEYRTERARKVWKVDLPNFDEARAESKINPDELRSKMKERGIAPPRIWNEKTLYFGSTVTVIDPYKPELDETAVSLSKGVASIPARTKEYFKHRKEVSHIKEFEGEDFSLTEFGIQSVNIYQKAHQALAENDNEGIFNYVTEYCHPLMTNGLHLKTMQWQYIGEVEPPRVVKVRTIELTKGNLFAQITVRMYTKQIVAVFDRHGRLIMGSPTDVREVLEYIVYEKCLANEYGEWRIHAKLR